MGMYDIIDGITVYCAKCGKIVTNDFQTKDIERPFLEHYKPGDTIPKDREFENMLEIHSICEHCEFFVSVYIKILDDKVIAELD